jgi:hypothetical protein
MLGSSFMASYFPGADLREVPFKLDASLRQFSINIAWLESWVKLITLKKTTQE